MLFDQVIHNGTLVTASDTFTADLGITGARIVAMGQGLRGRRSRTSRQPQQMV